jgi:hypothetical protein
MKYIELEINNDFVIIEQSNELYNYYVINSIKQWIFLTMFTKASIILTLHVKEIKITVDKKFIYNQDYILINDLSKFYCDI